MTANASVERHKEETVPSSAPTKNRSARPSVRVAVTGRDLAILGAVADFRFLTREQVERLFFGPRSPFPGFRRANTRPNGERASRDRLLRLYEAGYLQRLLAPRASLDLIVDQGAAVSPIAKPAFLYALTPKGAQLVADARDVPTHTLIVKKAHELTPAFLAHELAVSDIFIGLTHLTEDQPGWELLTWQDGRACFDTYVYRDQQWRFAPDAFVHLRLDGKDVACFLEVDRGTEGHTRIVEKVRSYAVYAASKRFAERYAGLRLFRVCFITTAGIRRAENLRATVEQQFDEVFWFTTRDQFVRAANPLTEPIWWRAGEPTLRAFWSQERVAT